ncbi:HIT family protein [Myroides pelagicus]|uniref:HIT family protein n=1 Tax=Myroides pelagicus TaxID=270914 RepID=UPI002DBC5457|nr:HIT family protein [Myroides pelagicus]MEC4113772.1 HIT family protein [Myroides pelagicus]
MKMIAFLDIDPINNGHILIIPKDHLLDLDALSEQLITSVFLIAQKLLKRLRRVCPMEGYTIMQNGGLFNDIGHFHLHLFPRNKSDGFGWVCDESREFTELHKVRALLSNE